MKEVSLTIICLDYEEMIALKIVLKNNKNKNKYLDCIEEKLDKEIAVAKRRDRVRNGGSKW